jgi:glycosyltransferase involved in cell wall biosynthesis
VPIESKDETELVLTPPAVADYRRTASVLLSHPTGNQNVRNALLALTEVERLAEFWTAIAWPADSLWTRILPPALQRDLARRSFTEAPADRVRSAPSRELIRLAMRFTPFEKILSSRERPFSVIGMYRHFDARVARRLRRAGADGVYAYEGGALQTFREAKRLGVRTFYELTTGHWNWKREFLQQEAQRNPESAPFLSGLKDSDRHLAEKNEELQLADLVFVPSHHVRTTLSGIVPDEKIRVVGYGAPAVEPGKRQVHDPREPLRVLFAGVLTRQKGIGYLLDAIELLGTGLEVTLIGRRINADPKVERACGKHRWFQTVPHSQMLETMKQSDVLVLPSFSEGFGMVVTEAMACGLPVIVTPNVGASDLITNGKEGFVVPPASAEAIAEALNVLVKDRELLVRMAVNAQNTAARNSWSNYRQKFAENVKTALCGQ